MKVEIIIMIKIVFTAFLCATIGYGILLFSVDLYFCIIAPLMFGVFLMSAIKAVQRWQDKSLFSCFSEFFSTLVFGYIWYISCDALNKIEQGLSPFKNNIAPEYWHVMVLVLAAIVGAIIILLAGWIIEKRKKYILFGGSNEIY